MSSSWPPPPPYQPSTDPCVLLSYCLATLLRIEDAVRVSEFAFAITRTTTGTGDAFAAEDTHRFARARFVTVFLWDENGGIVQLANDNYPEWQMAPLLLRGPQAYPLPMVTKAVRIRARTTPGAQAEYGIVALL